MRQGGVKACKQMALSPPERGRPLRAVCETSEHRLDDGR